MNGRNGITKPHEINLNLTPEKANGMRERKKEINKKKYVSTLQYSIYPKVLERNMNPFILRVVWVLPQFIPTRPFH